MDRKNYQIINSGSGKWEVGSGKWFNDFTTHYFLLPTHCLCGGWHGSPSGEEFLVARSPYKFPGGHGCSPVPRFHGDRLRGKSTVGAVSCPDIKSVSRKWKVVSSE